MLSPILYSTSASFTVSLSPVLVFDTVFASAGTTTGVTATPSGGFGTITYSWTILSQEGDGTLTINSPSSSTTTFTFSGLDFAGSEVSGTIKCTATDSLGRTAFSNIPVTVIRFG